MDNKEQNNKELILAIFSGKDRPGISAAITETLAKHDVTILDIGQSDTHNHLTLGVLFAAESSISGTILKELLFKANEL
ncbi:ACT domain-containing protein, partial [Porphyromonas levii]